MDMIVRLRSDRPPIWSVAASVLAAFFLAIGASRIVAAGALGEFGPTAAWVGAAEMVGGSMLLVPAAVSHAAFLLATVACLAASIDPPTAGRGIATAILLVSLVWLGYARRPRALLRARLDRAVEQVVRLEASRTEGVRREGF